MQQKENYTDNEIEKVMIELNEQIDESERLKNHIKTMNNRMGRIQ